MLSVRILVTRKLLVKFPGSQELQVDFQLQWGLLHLTTTLYSLAEEKL